MNKAPLAQKVIYKLGIPDVQHMTKDKIMEFAKIIPKMNPKTAKEAISQFPNFKELATTLVDQYMCLLNAALQENRLNQETLYKECSQTLDAFRSELMQENLTDEEQDRTEARMIEVIQIMEKSMSEDRTLKMFIIKSASTVILIAFIICAALLGEKVNLNSNDAKDDFDDESP